MAYSILVIEDDPNVRELIELKLRPLVNRNIINQIFLAEDPVIALDIFHKYKDSIRTVVCDHYLPVQNGLDLCEIIKSHNQMISIIYLTGDPRITKPDIEGKADHLLYKPEGIDQLLPLITKL